MAVSVSRDRDRDGALVYVMLSEHRDLAAARAIFRSAKAVTGVTPDRVTTDGRDTYPRAIRIRTRQTRAAWDEPVSQQQT
jgi:transposase-like protein